MRRICPLQVFISWEVAWRAAIFLRKYGSRLKPARCSKCKRIHLEKQRRPAECNARNVMLPLVYSKRAAAARG